MTKNQFLQEYCKNFSLVELLYDFDSGGLSNKLRRAGLADMAELVEQIPKNARCLQELYRICGWNPDATEDEIRQKINPLKLP